MAIKAVIFDLDDTLIVDEAITKEAMRLTAAQASKQHGVDQAVFLSSAARIGRSLWEASASYSYCLEIGIIDHECLWGEIPGDSAETAALRGWALSYRSALFDAVLRAQEISDEDAADALAQTFASSRRRLQRLMPDAKETLARLQSSRRIALLTNGDSGLQREKVASSGLEKFFDAIVISGEHGIGKPQAGIFHSLLAKLGVHASEAVMVGNSLERDIAGAKNAGLAASIWLRVSGSEEYADVVPDHTIDGLHELSELIDSLPSK